MTDSKFARSMAQTFISATVANMVSQVAMRGLNGAKEPPKFAPTLVGGLMCGTAFIAYPVALKILSKASPAFAANMNDPKGKKCITYVCGGATAALILTAVNYPLSRIMEACNGGKCAKCCHIKNMAGFYADQVFVSIGFAATNGTLSTLIPTSKNSLINWGRFHFIVNASNIGGKVLAWPVLKLRHNASLTSTICGYLKGVPGVILTGDGVGALKQVTAFIAE